MSLREKFLSDFELLSHTLRENISVFYVTDFGNALGITFLELSQISNRLSLYFLEIFEENHPYIGVFVKDYFCLPCLILAVWKSGKIFSGIGKQYSITDTLYYLNSLKVKYLITDTNTNEYSGKFKSEFFIQDKKFYIWERPKLWKDVMMNNGLKEVCYGIMTSGTTSEPKIIHVPWDCILPNVVELSEEFEINTSDCIFQASPCSFDPFFIELFLMLLKGCSLMIVPDAIKLGPKNLLKILFLEFSGSSDQAVLNICNAGKDTYFYMNIKQVKKPCITILQITPSVFKMWSDKEIKEYVLSCHSSLRVLVLGGESFPKNILELKHPGNTTKIFNIYGITEISCWAFLNEVTHLPLNEEVSLGKPLKNIKYKISHDDELFLGSSSRICYIEAELMEDIEGVVFRKTNDIVRLDEGKIYYVGRSNEIIKKYGIKVNLMKIEKSFTNIKIKICHCVYNDKSKKLGLFFVPVVKTSEINFRPISYEEFCKNFGAFTTETLSDIEKPDCFIEMQELPINYHGKFDKKILREYLTDVGESVAYKTDLKIAFRNQWMEILNLKIFDFSSKNFIDLGGNSLLALQLINRLTNLGFKVPQNLISQLLSKESYDSCLKSFKNAQNEDERMESVTTKKRKIFNVSPEGGVQLILRWKFGLGKCVDAIPNVFTYEREERVVVGSHSSKLSCIHATTGREIWTVSLGGRIESGFRTNRDNTKGFIGCYDHFAYCVALLDGTFLWKFKTGDMIKSTPCLSTDEKILYVASYDTKLYCLSTETGEALHVLKLSEGGIYCSGIVGDSLNAFYIGTLNGTCVSVEQETNQIIWKADLQSPVFASPCLLESKNEIIFSEVLGIVHCLNALDGTEMWTFKADNNIYSSPVAHRSHDVFHILFGCHDEHLYCLNYGQTCELNWKCRLDSPIFGKPLILRKTSTVSVASTQGVVYLCDLNSGSIRSHLKLDGEVFSSVINSGNRLFVGCRDDNIYRLDVT